MADNFFKKPFMRFKVIPRLAYFLTLLDLKTCRIKYHNEENYKLYVERENKGENIIFGSWHGRGMLLPAIYRFIFGYDKLSMMVSQSKDGDILASYFNLLNVECVRGSAHKGGVAALRNLANITKSGRDTAVALDGSRGPRHRIEPGLVFLSRLTGAPIIPLGVSAKFSFRANSWDRCMVIFPFATIHIVFGTPFVVPKDAKDLEPYCEKLQSIMDEITIQGDELAGIKPDGKGPERVKGA